MAYGSSKTFLSDIRLVNLGFEISVCSRMTWICSWSVYSHCPWWARSCDAVALIFMLDKLS